MEIMTQGQAYCGSLIAADDIQAARIRLTRTTVAVDPPSITTLALGTVVVAVPGVKVGEAVLAQPPATLEAGLVPISAIVTATDQVTLTLLNAKGTTVDGASLNWVFTRVG